MSDIETRIEGLLSQNYQVGSREYWQARAEAAEMETARYRAALERIAFYNGAYVVGTIFMATVAREALEAKS